MNITCDNMIKLLPPSSPYLRKRKVSQTLGTGANVLFKVQQGVLKIKNQKQKTSLVRLALLARVHTATEVDAASEGTLTFGAAFLCCRVRNETESFFRDAEWSSLFAVAAAGGEHLSVRRSLELRSR